ncbi:MAG: efflux RND transporter periplasmic adaptor subunit [Hyphomicrobiaceae bacterium]|nr:efflux RND transporter periplasmic adaptor subunit [Hyphomicrobiaceae bacterium]
MFGCLLLVAARAAAEDTTKIGQDIKQYAGTVVAARQADIAPRVDGLLQKVLFLPGQFVKQNDVLFEFMPKEKELQLEIERARLKRAEAKLQLADTELSNKQALRKKDAVAEVQLLQAQATRDTAAADVEEARTTVRIAELTIKELTLYAPFDGIVSEALVPEGTFLKRDVESKLARIIQLDPIRVSAEAPFDAYYERRQVTKTDEETLKNIELTLILPNGVEYSHKGRLVSGGYEFRVESQKIQVWAEFPNPDHLLRPGLKVMLQSQLVR